MEEKILIKSENYNIKKIIKIFTCVFSVIAILSFVLNLISVIIEFHKERQWIMDLMNTLDVTRKSIKEMFPKNFGLVNFFKYILKNGEFHKIVLPIVMLFACIAVLGVIHLWLNSYELTVTDKRIYGKIAFGKRVDLPVDSVSATATVSLLKGVAVSTSSGKIKFLVMKNAEEIYKVLNTLIIERQSQKNAQPQIITSQSNAEELKKYKELLDSGIISQEEFDAKKKQLLGL